MSVREMSILENAVPTVSGGGFWAGLLLLSCLGLSVIGPASATAAPIPNLTLKDDPADFGNLAQGATKCPMVNCGPTAAINSFVFLQNKYPKIYGNMLIGNAAMKPTPKELVAAANSLGCTFFGNCQPPVLALGTPIGDFILGKRDYFTAMAPKTTQIEAQISETWGNMIVLFHKGMGVLQKPGFVQDGTKPTANFLFDQLKAGEDVEIVLRGPGTFHYLTLTGIDFNPNTNTGKIFTIDPGTGRPTAPLTTALGKAGQFKDYLVTNYNGFAGAAILDAVAESPIPKNNVNALEPDSLTLLLSALLGMGLTRGAAGQTGRWPRQKRGRR